MSGPRYSDVNRRWAPLDPEVWEIVHDLPAVDIEDPSSARVRADRLFDRLTGSAPDCGTIGALVDAGGVVAAHYTPSDAGFDAGVLVFAHGGGFVTGNLRSVAARCQRLADISGAHVVSVEYRLAPESTFPCAIEDVLRVVHWVRSGALAGPVDPTRIGVGGVSAGGAIAAAAAQIDRDQDRFLSFQLLDQPVLDARLATGSSAAGEAAPLISRTFLEHMWRHYLGDGWRRRGLSAPASPGLRQDLSGLPAAFLSVAEVDPLRDEALNYAARLTDAGVSVELHLYPGSCHGFTGMLGTSVARRALLDQGNAIHRALVRRSESA